MIFPHIFRNIPAGSSGKNQQRINDQDTDPFDRQHDNKRNKNRKQILNQTHPELFAFRQRPVQTYRLQTIITENPEHYGGKENQKQIYDFPLCDAQNISHQKTGILAEIAASGQNNKSDGDTAGGKHRDDRICVRCTLALNPIQKQSK